MMTVIKELGDKPVVVTRDKTVVKEVVVREEEPKETDELSDLVEGKKEPVVDELEAERKRLKEEKTVTELRAMCKDMGLSGYSKLKEDELVELILENKNK